MSEHEARCAVEIGYNWCTCIRYAEIQVQRGFELHLKQAGQVRCAKGHEVWRIQHRPCPSCKAQT